MTLQEKIILEMGRQLATKGCRAITMDEIAQNTGISKRTLYENFTDKESLIEQCLLFYVDKIVEDTNKTINEAENSLDAILKIIYNKSEFARRFGYTALADIKKYYPAVFHTIFEKRNWDKEKNSPKVLFAKAIEEGLIISYINLDFIMNMLELNVHSAMRDEYLERNNFYTQKVIAYLHILIILRGIATIKGVEFIDNFSTKIRDFSQFDINK
ncbi:MAG: TetR/AcrR family transcriptional regulator [Bacteroidales bacterium]|nr:TetR/AcrR family transcriptional regulator [Bacteroidales bacterium]